MHRTLAVALLALPAALSAQSLEGAPATESRRAVVVEALPGERVRVRAPALHGRVVGMVIARSADSLVISRTAEQIIRVPAAAITSLEVSRGRSRLRGAWRGMLWGAGVGILLGAVQSPVRDENGPRYSRGQAMSDGAGYLGWAGFFIGGIVGRERWVPAQPAEH